MSKTDETKHIEAVNAALRKYVALVNAESKDVDAWQAVARDLDQLKELLRGDKREFVRWRAIDARQRADRHDRLSRLD